LLRMITLAHLSEMHPIQTTAHSQNSTPVKHPSKSSSTAVSSASPWRSWADASSDPGEDISSVDALPGPAQFVLSARLGLGRKATRQAKASQTKKCGRFIRGRCNYGDLCKFKHTPAAPSSKTELTHLLGESPDLDGVIGCTASTMVYDQRSSIENNSDGPYQEANMFPETFLWVPVLIIEVGAEVLHVHAENAQLMEPNESRLCLTPDSEFLTTNLDTLDSFKMLDGPVCSRHRVEICKTWRRFLICCHHSEWILGATCTIPLGSSPGNF